MLNFDWPILRQTFNGIVEDVQFVQEGPHDYIVSLSPVPTQIPKNRRFIVAMENPKIKEPDLNWGRVISPFPYENTILSQPSIPWFYGMKLRTDSGTEHWLTSEYMDLEDLVSMPIPEKTKIMSAVVSSKNFLPGHQNRVQFMNKVIERFPQVDVFGFGHRPIADKKDAIDPYMFSICIENDVVDHYWTEKISDVFLGYTTPVYWGAPNIMDYFPEGSLVNLNLNDHESSLRAIQGLLDRPVVDILQVIEARRKVLFQYNLPYMLTKYL